MKFILVLIICFGTDCEALYDKNLKFETYNDCYSTAVSTANYMREIYPSSSGEVHCWNEEQTAVFEKWLEDGNKPLLESTEPLPKGIDA